MLSLNVKSISNFLKRRTILTWCRNRNTATTSLQETNSKVVTEVKWKTNEGEGNAFVLMVGPTHMKSLFSQECSSFQDC